MPANALSDGLSIAAGRAYFLYGQTLYEERVAVSLRRRCKGTTRPQGTLPSRATSKHVRGQKECALPMKSQFLLEYCHS